MYTRNAYRFYLRKSLLTSFNIKCKDKISFFNCDRNLFKYLCHSRNFCKDSSSNNDKFNNDLNIKNSKSNIKDLKKDLKNKSKDNVEKSEIKQNDKFSKRLIEPTEFIVPDVSSDKAFEEKFWAEYQSQQENKFNPDTHYLDRIRYRKQYKNPTQRALNILKDDILEFFGKLKYNSVVALRDPAQVKKFVKQRVFPNTCDILIIGGGAVGMSIAYHIQEKAKGSLQVVVCEKDVSYSRSSTPLSVGGIRQQFTTGENIILSKYGMDFLQNAPQNLHVEGVGPPDLRVNFNGYLTLASEVGFEQLMKNFEFQRMLGSVVEMLTKKKLKAKFPWINVEDIEGGVYGLQREGWIDPWSLLVSLSKKCREMDVQIVNGEVGGPSMQLLGDLFTYGDEPYRMRQARSVEVKLPDGEIRPIQFYACVIAAGTDSGNIAKQFGVGTAPEGPLSVPLPLEPRKRFVYCIKSPNGPGLNCPFVIDPTGTYFRRDGLADMYLCGRSPPDDGLEPDPSNLDVDYSFFEDHVWPRLAQRCPSFENLKIHSAWAGNYDYNSFDQNAIIGRHPSFSNLFIASGFSGHGIQHAAGAGKAIADLIIDGESETLDIKALGVDRILYNMPFKENMIY